MVSSDWSLFEVELETWRPGTQKNIGNPELKNFETGVKQLGRKVTGGFYADWYFNLKPKWNTGKQNTWRERLQYLFTVPWPMQLVTTQ